MGLFDFFTKGKKRKSGRSDLTKERPKQSRYDEHARDATHQQLNRYKAGGIDHYIFLATLDTTTCPECAKLDMRRFPLAAAMAGVNLPPMHDGCRCTTVPYIGDDELDELEERAARDPVTGKSNTVPGNMSYSEWYEKYVKGNAEAEANYKMSQNIEEDEQQFLLFQKVLGTRMPKSVVSFQRTKYKYPEKWIQLLADYKKYSDLGISPPQDISSTEDMVFYNPVEEQIVETVKNNPGILQKDLTEMLKKEGAYQPASILNSLANRGIVVKIRNGRSYSIYAIEDAPDSSQ